MEDHSGAALVPNPMTRNEPIPGVDVEEAAIQENYGEIPGRLTDQGDRRQTPMTKEERREAGRARRSRRAATRADYGLTRAACSGKPSAR